MNGFCIYNLLNIITFLLSVQSILTVSISSEERRDPRMWGEWGSYHQCDAVCGKGLSFRYRECLLDHCAGKSCEATPCEGPPCAEGLERGVVNGTWGQWGDYRACDVDCGNGHKYRYRECESDKCSGYNYEYVECTSNKCEGGWSNWAVSACSQPCGYGTRHKVRQCILPTGTALSREEVCDGPSHTTVSCNVQTCPLYAGQKCYDPNDPQGYRGDVNTPIEGKRCFFWNHYNSPFRTGNYPTSGLSRNFCRNPDGNPGGPWCFVNPKRNKRSFCDVQICPSEEDVYWNTWSDWSDCSVGCDEGYRYRVRNCHGGSITQGGCYGDQVEARICHLIPCGQTQIVEIIPSSTASTSTTIPSTTIPPTTIPTTTPEPIPQCGHPDVNILPPQSPSIMRIVGGEDAANGSIPWQVSLQVNHVVNIRMCGGSIISKDWIMTAAHCIKKGRTFADYKGVVGSFSFDNPDPHQKTVFFKALYVHEEYNTSTLENDIALLKMTTPLNFTSFIKPTCLPEASDADKFTVGKKLLVTGWGSLSGGFTPSFPDGLQQVYVPMVLRADCNNAYRSYAPLPQGVVCAGYLEEGGQDSCSGDSGGPLVDVDTFEQIGVVSWGIDCAQPGYPGVYTYVPHYIPWIKKITENHDE